MGHQKHIISFSGGIGSAASAIIARDLGLDFEIVFADTTIEDEDLYRFNGDIAKALDKDLITLRDGRDPWDVFVDVSYIGNSRTAHCSRILKTKQVRDYIKSSGYENPILVLGMYRDEEDRLEVAKRNWNGVTVKSLLIENSIYPGMARDMVEGLGVEIPRLYKMGFPHNNCGGFCVRAGQGQAIHLLKTRPDFYNDMMLRNIWARSEIQRKTQDRIDAGTYRGKSESRSSGGFIRVKRGDDTKYFHLDEFKDRVKNGEFIPDPNDFGGCGCFVDDEQGSLFDD